VLTKIPNPWRLGELLSKQRAAEISFKSLKFMHTERAVRLKQGVGSLTGTTSANKYWSKKEESL
jgi:dimeric dUTPase (all-alpha-NTP-PPase superfamily)